jgi:hypothetical protein
MAQALLVLAEDHARTPDGPATYGQIGQLEYKKWFAFWSIPRTKATCVETVEQAKAPVAFPISANRTVFNVPVAAYLHRDGALQITNVTIMTWH